MGAVIGVSVSACAVPPVLPLGPFFLFFVHACTTAFHVSLQGVSATERFVTIRALVSTLAGMDIPVALAVVGATKRGTAYIARKSSRGGRRTALRDAVRAGAMGT